MPADTADMVQSICPCIAFHPHIRLKPAATANQTHATIFGARGALFWRSWISPSFSLPWLFNKLGRKSLR